MLWTNADGVRAMLCSGFTFDKVHLGRADETSDEFVARGVVQFERGANLFDHTSLQNHDFVCHGHRFDLIVGHVDHGRFQALVEF